MREMLEKNGIRNDERYRSETAHITFCRFRKELNNPKKLVKELDRYREYVFGRESVEYIELVEHDWYNRGERRKDRHT